MYRLISSHASDGPDADSLSIVPPSYFSPYALEAKHFVGLLCISRWKDFKIARIGVGHARCISRELRREIKQDCCRCLNGMHAVLEKVNDAARCFSTLERIGDGD